MNLSEARLFAVRFAAGVYDPVEHQQFLGLVQQASLSDLQVIAESFEQAYRQQAQVSGAGPNAYWMEALEQKLNKSTEQPPVTVKSHENLIYRIVRVAVAASIILMLGTGAYFLLVNKTGEQNQIVENTPAKDVKAPAVNRARITLGGGQTIFLDSAISGELAHQGNISLVKKGDGQIAYEGPARATGASPLIYNTLINPRGSRIVSLTLSDGTRVWLNAESSLRYPAVFLGNERKVEITGEGYFEVAHNAAMPFRVSKGDVTVTVLGTRFNVNAYDNEQQIKVTLLEGSVKISARAASGILKPGEQMQIGRDQQLTLNRDIDPGKIMSWKNNEFIFGDDDISTIMRQLSRWYDINPVFEGPIDAHHYTGRISMDVPVSEVLAMFEKLQFIKIDINGKNVITKKR